MGAVADGPQLVVARAGRRSTEYTRPATNGARSILAGRPQIFVETGADIRHEQLLDAHAAAREFLLIEITHERIEGRAAALDRIVPDLRPEYVARRFRLLDHPGKTDRQRDIFGPQIWDYSI